LLTPEREQAIQHAIDVMTKGLPWGRRLAKIGVKSARATMGFDTNILVYATASVPDARR
jgi:hypothetical protein